MDKEQLPPVLALPYGVLGDPYSGKSMLDLLNEGHPIKLFKQDGSSVCLQMPKPIPCIGADIPKSPLNETIDSTKPDKPVALAQQYHHARRHRVHNRCAR